MADHKPRKRVIPVDPLALTESMGFKTYRRISRRPWLKEEDAGLSSFMETNYGQLLGNPDFNLDKVDWERAAQAISRTGPRNPKDCRKRWTNSLDPTLRRGRWEPEEDAQLIEAYKKHGASWQKVLQMIPGRTDDQCAKRYIEVLDPNTKDRLLPWTHEEDLRLIRLVRMHGTKWRTILTEFKSRPSLTCRNRWRKILTDVVRGKADGVIKQEVESINSNMTGQQEPHDVVMRDVEPMVQPNSLQKETPSVSETEWRYTFSGNEQGLPHTSIFSDGNGGIISNRELVQQLIMYAKSHNLEITVHQHIHHHYAPPPLLLDPVQVKQTHHHHVGESETEAKENTAFLMEPESQLTRHQHFNYLSPLTELPKLTSSALSPSGSSKDSLETHHHHHEKKKEKESNLVHILNNDKEAEKPESGNVMTPLTQAVEMAVAAEASKRPGENTGPLEKRAKMEIEHEEDGMDFWDTMRNLSEVRGQMYNKGMYNNKSGDQVYLNKDGNKVYQTKDSYPKDLGNLKTGGTDSYPQSTGNIYRNGETAYPTADSSNNEGRFGMNQTGYSQQYQRQQDSQYQRQGSQYHQRPAQTNVFEIEEMDEEAMNSYGLFYNVYTKEGSVLPETQPEQPPPDATSVYDSWGGGFGIIPFNPS